MTSYCIETPLHHHTLLFVSWCVYFYLQYRYDPEQERVVIEPIEMAQEFRKFDYTSTWENFPHFRDAEEVPIKKEGEEK